MWQNWATVGPLFSLIIKLRSNTIYGQFSFHNKRYLKILNSVHGSRSTFVTGEYSLKENPLVHMNKVLFPPFHIKLGLMKNFVKALHKNGAAFQHISHILPG